MKKLFLSHNNLVSLRGIEVFEKLTHLSVASNYIDSMEEFSHIKNPAQIECLSVKGNLAIERHPDYKCLLIENFKNMKELDS